MLPRKLKRIALAIAAAVCLHLGFFALLALLPRPREAQRLPPMQVTLLHTERALEAPAQVAPPSPAPARVAKKARRAREAAAQQGGESVRASGEAPGAGAGIASSAAQPSPRPLPWSHEWLIAEGLHRESAPPGGLQIDLDHPSAQLGPGRPQPEPLGPVRVKTREEALAEEQERVEARVGGWLSETKARDRAGPGRDASWQSLEDALAKGFSPGWKVIDEGPATLQKSAVRGAIEAWKKQAEAYGKSGNPFAGSKDSPGAPHQLARDLPALANDDRGLGSRSLEGFGGWWLSAGVGGTSGSESGFTHRLISLVRVTQREDGSIIAIELAGSSGNLVYDKIVLKKADALRTLHLAPPKTGLESLWAFETRFTRVPPMPIAGCALDESFLPKDCWYPLQRRTESSVHLQAIY